MKIMVKETDIAESDNRTIDLIQLLLDNLIPMNNPKPSHQQSIRCQSHVNTSSSHRDPKSMAAPAITKAIILPPMTQKNKRRQKPTKIKRTISESWRTQ
ncbi:unnamed protein product [Camellia sinensis]